MAVEVKGLGEIVTVVVEIEEFAELQIETGTREEIEENTVTEENAVVTEVETAVPKTGTKEEMEVVDLPEEDAPAADPEAVVVVTMVVVPEPEVADFAPDETLEAALEAPLETMEAPLEAPLVALPTAPPMMPPAPPVVVVTVPLVAVELPMPAPPMRPAPPVVEAVPLAATRVVEPMVVVAVATMGATTVVPLEPAPAPPAVTVTVATEPPENKVSKWISRSILCNYSPESVVVRVVEAAAGTITVTTEPPERIVNYITRQWTNQQDLPPRVVVTVRTAP